MSHDPHPIIAAAFADSEPAAALGERMRGGDFTDDARRAWAGAWARRADHPRWPGATRPEDDACLSPHASCSGIAALPDHATCAPGYGHDGCCWCWAGCSDPACDHPACDGARWRRWAKLYDAAPVLPDRDVRLWEQPWRPWIEHGRNAELIKDEPHPGSDRAKIEKAAEKMLAALHRGPTCPYSTRGVPSELALDAELELARRGVALEERSYATVSLRGFAAAIAAGRIELAPGGCASTSELRLAGHASLLDAPAVTTRATATPQPTTRAPETAADEQLALL